MSVQGMDCGPRCRSKQHALQLLTAITRGTTRQIQLFLKRCHNARSLTDNTGRTVLHMAASCGKWEVVNWLLEELKMELNLKDVESGWTALHRAFFYGQIHCARILIEHGANSQSRDKEGLTPLDLIMKDRLPHVEYSPREPTEVFMWGDNTNATLGHDKMQARRQPEVVDYFRKRAISIKEVAMSKYHTVFLSSDGRVYTCGHGRGGRLGHGNEQTIVIPHLVEAIQKEECVEISAARDHTVFRMASGALYSCGLNDSHQLGQFPTPTYSLVPKQMNHKMLKGKTIEGVCAQRFHTVTYTKDAVYTFGLNAGQLGHLKVAGEEYVSQPRQVSALNHKDVRIMLVSSSDAATVVVTTKGDVYALHEYQCRKVVSKWLDVVKVVVSGGCLDHNSDLDTLREKGGNELTIVLLNSAGKAFLWRSSDPVLRRCIWGIRRPLRLVQVALSMQNMAFVSQDGEAFTATIPRRQRRTSTTKVEASPAPIDTFSVTLSDLVDKEEVEDVRINRIPLVHRATGIMVDRKGNNFAVLQCQPNASLTEVPSICESEMGLHFKTLLEESDTFDCIHDVIIEVGNEQLAAHRYILACRSEYFRELLMSKHYDPSLLPEGHKPVIGLDSANPDLVRQMLRYIYTDSCDLLRVGSQFKLMSEEGVNGHVEKQNSEKGKKKKGGKGTEKGDGANGSSGKKNPVKLLQEMAKKYGVKNLTKRLEAVKYVNGKIIAVSGRSLPTPHLRFDRKKFGMMYDVCIRGDDGEEVPCHKCVLVARLEYFHSMLASGWIETSSSEALTLPVPSDILQVILDFLYIDDAPKITVCEDVEYLCNLLVVADQLLITRLKDMTEVAIANLLSLRNVCEVLELASVYNAGQLRATCQQFICLNLAALCEIRALDVLSAEVIDELTLYYRNMVGSMSRRQVTPYDEWPRADYLEALEQLEPLEEPGTPNTPRDSEHATKKHRPRRRRTRTKSSGDEKCAERQVSVSSETDLAIDLDQVMETEEGPTEESPEPISPIEPVPKKQITVIRRDLSRPWVGSPKADQVKPIPASQPLHIPSVTPAPRAYVTASPENVVPTSPTDVTSLRGIMAEQDLSESHMKTNKTPGSAKKVAKMSQKERKRMAAGQSSSIPLKESPTEPTPATPPAWSAVPAWGGMNSMVKSFKELMLDEEKDRPPVKVASPRPAPSQPPSVMATSPPSSRKGGSAGDNVLSWGLPITNTRSARPAAPTSPGPSPGADSGGGGDNPWQRRQKPAAARAVSFTEIISDEMEQKATLVKLTNKPLHLIQIEEQAIQELLTSYGATDSWDEYVTVSREHCGATLATPTWAATQ